MGTKLRQARKEAKLSQGELARRAGYKSKATVSHWERGTAQPPISKARIVAKVLNRHVEELF